MSQGLLNSIGRIPRNKLLNPDSAIDQRNNGALVSGASSGYTVDRKLLSFNVASKITAQQYSTVLGVNQVSNSSLKYAVAAQYAPVASDFIVHVQIIEGTRMRDLLWGSSFARPMVYTIQGMWPIAGDYSVAIRNAAADRSYVTKFTVSQANTLETHTVIIPGCTDGVWPITNAAHSSITLCLGAGSGSTTSTINQWQAGNYFKAAGTVDLCAQANGSAIYIAWEQYERDMRTDFILPDYDDELRHCQRYLPAVTCGPSPDDVAIGTTASTGSGTVLFMYPVEPRVPPTSVSGSPPSAFNLTTGTTSSQCSALTLGGAGKKYARLTVSGTGTPYGANQPLIMYGGSGAKVLFDGCEL